MFPTGTDSKKNEGFKGNLEESKNFIHPTIGNINEFKRRRDDASELIRKEKRAKEFNNKRLMEFQTTVKTISDSKVMMDDESFKFTNRFYGLGVSDFRNVAVVLTNKDNSKHLSALQWLNEALSNKHYAPIQQCIDAGLVAILFDLVPKIDKDSQVFFVYVSIKSLADRKSVV